MLGEVNGVFMTAKERFSKQITYYVFMLREFFWAFLVGSTGTPRK